MPSACSSWPVNCGEATGTVAPETRSAISGGVVPDRSEVRAAGWCGMEACAPRSRLASAAHARKGAAARGAWVTLKDPYLVGFDLEPPMLLARLAVALADGVAASSCSTRTGSGCLLVPPRLLPRVLASPGEADHAHAPAIVNPAAGLVGAGLQAVGRTPDRWTQFQTPPPTQWRHALTLDHGRR